MAVPGETCLMLNTPSNLNFVRVIEAAGGEVIPGTIMDRLCFVDWRRRDLSPRFGPQGLFTQRRWPLPRPCFRMARRRER